MSNLDSSSVCRKSRSSHTLIKQSKSYRDYLLVPNTVTRAKIQDVRKFALAKNILHDSKEIFSQFDVKNCIGYRYLHEFARTSQDNVKQRERTSKLSRVDVVVENSMLKDLSLDIEIKDIHSVTDGSGFNPIELARPTLTLGSSRFPSPTE